MQSTGSFWLCWWDIWVLLGLWGNYYDVTLWYHYLHLTPVWITGLKNILVEFSNASNKFVSPMLHWIWVVLFNIIILMSCEFFHFFLMFLILHALLFYGFQYHILSSLNYDLFPVLILNWLLTAGTESTSGKFPVDSGRHYSSYAGHIGQLVNWSTYFTFWCFTIFLFFFHLAWFAFACTCVQAITFLLKC